MANKCCIPDPFACPNLCDQIESNSAEATTNCIEATTGTKEDDIKALLCDPCSDATVENTDLSYQDAVASGGTLVLPDITHTDSDLSPVILPAQVPMVCTPCVPNGIAYPEPALTAITGIFRNRDDGWRKANGFRDDVNPANPIYTQALDPSSANPTLTLLYDNFFGNKNRFTDDQGGQIYGAGNGSTANYIVDNYRNRGIWDQFLLTFWDNLVDNSPVVGPYNAGDFFLMDFEELSSLMVLFTIFNFNRLNYPPFNNNIGEFFYSSSTNLNSSANKWGIDSRFNFGYGVTGFLIFNGRGAYNRRHFYIP